jgi:hypothetical protein
MALTKDQQAAKLKAIDAKIAKVEQAVKDVEQLRAEREWIASAPIVAPKVRKPRAKKAVVEPETASA